jgi:adenylate kinase
MPLVCVFGVSGVGKTTLIGQFVQNHKNWRVMSAAELLAQLLGQERDALRRLNRPEIESNQVLLAEEISRHYLAEADANWLLDAHSVINNGRELIPVPVSVVARINPGRLLFLFDEAADIGRRRTSDNHRARPRLGSLRIAEEQRVAWLSCIDYAQELNIGLYRVDVNDPRAFADAVLGASEPQGAQSESPPLG